MMAPERLPCVVLSLSTYTSTYYSTIVVAVVQFSQGETMREGTEVEGRLRAYETSSVVPRWDGQFRLIVIN